MYLLPVMGCIRATAAQFTRSAYASVYVVATATAAKVSVAAVNVSVAAANVSVSVG